MPMSDICGLKVKRAIKIAVITLQILFTASVIRYDFVVSSGILLIIFFVLYVAAHLTVALFFEPGSRLDILFLTLLLFLTLAPVSSFSEKLKHNIPSTSTMSET